MEAAGGGQMGFSPSWRRDELRRLRRLRRRWSSDPLLAWLRPGDRSPTARRSVEPVLKGKRLLGTAATDRRREVREDPPKLPQLEPCPDDWLYYKKKCYYHSRAMADWNSSQEFCSAYGASLAVVDSHQELDFIMYRIRITDFWIGLRRKGNKFFWVNGELFNTNLDSAKSVEEVAGPHSVLEEYCCHESRWDPLSPALDNCAFCAHNTL
ncbi:C-type lectin domain family 2 member L-like isoform 7-T12 [Ciconia maguari]